MTTDDTNNNELAFKSLVEAIKQHRLVLFAGAGSSRRAGYPLWDELIRILRRRMQTALGGEYSSHDHEVEDPLWQAERIKKWTGWEATINEVFQTKEYTAFHKRLIELPFHRVFTVNYDLLLENASHSLQQERWLEPLHYYEGSQVEKFIRMFHGARTAENGNVVFHLHGSQREWKKAILSEEQYRQFYVDENPIRNLLWMIVSTYSVFFVGFGLSDWDFLYIFRLVRHRMGSEHPNHFAILAHDNNEDRVTRRNYLNDKYGIQPIFYDLENRTIGGKNPRVVPDYEKNLDPLVNRLSKEIYPGLTDYVHHNLPNSFFDWLEGELGELPRSMSSADMLTLQNRTDEFLRGDS